METIILIAIVGTLNIACFFIGAKVGQLVVKGEEVTLDVPNPIEAYKEHREKKEADREREYYDKVLRNIEKYDGTSYGQEEV